MIQERWESIIGAWQLFGAKIENTDFLMLEIMISDPILSCKTWFMRRYDEKFCNFSKDTCINFILSSFHADSLPELEGIKNTVFETERQISDPNVSQKTQFLRRYDKFFRRFRKQSISTCIPQILVRIASLSSKKSNLQAQIFFS